MTATNPIRSSRTALTLCAAVAVVAAATPAYAVQPSPSPSGTEPGLTWSASKMAEADANAFAVTRPAPHLTWAAGIHTVREGERYLRTVPTLWERDERTGGGWKKLPTAPLPGSYETRFNDVDTSSTRNALVVGDYVQEAGGIITQRWDGQAWKTEKAPVPAETMTAGFLSVDARNSRDAWAAGWSSVPDPEHVVKAVGELQHWDGTRWTPAKLPDMGEGPGGNWTLSGVTALAHDDVWAVGEAFNEAWSRPLLLHFDGTRWRKAPAPDLGEERVRLNGVTSGPNGEVWAVGRAKAPGAPARGLALRFSGGTWTEVPLPQGVNPLRSATFGGSAPLLLAQADDAGAAVVLERTGTTWTSMNLPAAGAGGTEFAAVDISARGRIVDVSGKFPGPDMDPAGPAAVLTARR